MPRTNTSKARTKNAKRATAKASSSSRTRIDADGEDSASKLISARIAELGDWRGDVLQRVRKLIKDADPDVTEEWKWRKATSPGTPVWSHNGGICTGETYREVVKLTFFKGASLPDPASLFNSSLEGNVRRAIDIREGVKFNERAFKSLIRAAVSLNTAGNKKSGAGRGEPTRPTSSRARLTTRTGAAAKSTKRANKTDASARQPVARRNTRAGARTAGARTDTTKPRLLSGGNPQIAKGDGDAPVQAYIAAMPGWTRDIGRRLDAVIVRTVPNVRKAVKWNSPFYGIEGQGWFLSFHVFTRYVKVTFFRGASLRPALPGSGKDKDARWVDIYEGELNETQLAEWVKQAAAIPGWIP